MLKYTKAFLFGDFMDIYLKKLNISLAQALKFALPGDILHLDNKIYNEKIVIYKPNLTLIGEENTKVVFNDCNATKIRYGNGESYGTTGSATFRVLEGADGFKAENIIFENSYIRDGSKGSQAVAFKSECNNIYLKNCKFIGHQDTLYIDFGKNNVVENCYICGDVDFIFGSADCLFKNCHIHAINDEKDIAYYTAPDTFIENDKGFIFDGCTFTHDDNMEVYLGRPWYPSKSRSNVYPKISFINSNISDGVFLYLKRMHENDILKYSFNIENCNIGGKNEKEKGSY